MIQDCGQRVQGGLLRGLFALLRLLGPVRASSLGGMIARNIGPRLGVSRVADRNLLAALPELSAADRRRVVRAVWDNLGRTMAELPTLARLGPTSSGPGWELAGDPDTLALARSGRALFFAGHLANWELLTAVARHERVPFGVFYRAAGNAAVDAAILALRAQIGGPGLAQFPKGAVGARRAMHHLRRGGSLGMLIDQKTNDGIAVPFFGRPAMTAPALAALAARFDRRVIPARVERLGPARLRITFEPPLPATPDPAVMMLQVNQCLERWIRERPGEWLWLHRRWPRERQGEGAALDPPGVRRPLDPR